MKELEEVIKKYLATREDVDTSKPNKSFEDCARYIQSVARQKATNGCYAMPDEEFYGLAVHYFDEENIEIEEVTPKPKPMEKPLIQQIEEQEQKKKEKKSNVKKAPFDDGIQLTLF